MGRLATFLCACMPAFAGAAAARDLPSKPCIWRDATAGAGGFAPNIVFSRAKPDLASGRGPLFGDRAAGADGESRQ